MIKSLVAKTHENISKYVIKNASVPLNQKVVHLSYQLNKDVSPPRLTYPEYMIRRADGSQQRLLCSAICMPQALISTWKSSPFFTVILSTWCSSPLKASFPSEIHTSHSHCNYPSSQKPSDLLALF